MRTADGPLLAWADLRLTARQAGPGRALALLHALVGRDTIVYGPAGHAIVPVSLASTARSHWSGGHVRQRDTARESYLTPAVLCGTDLVALRHDDAAAADPAAYLPWLAGLAWLRLGLSGRLFSESVSYLSERQAGAAPLLHQQLIRGALADVLIQQMEIEAMLDDPGPATLARPAGEPAWTARTMADLHDQITAGDREMCRLLGASSFTTAGPGWLACLSELLADTYATCQGAES